MSRPIGLIVRFQVLTIFLIVVTLSSVAAKYRCIIDGKRYKLGTPVPSDDPCKTCKCIARRVGQPEVMCTTQTCDVCSGKREDDGTCCGKCVEVEKCDVTKCPKLRCSKRFQFKTDAMCCRQCKCRYKRKLHLPGVVGDRCDGCQCDGTDGRVKCEPPVCSNATVQCVDPVMGDDCCYHCPNGKTCSPVFSPKTIIRYGEYKQVKKTICACAGSEWYPYAFCASPSINKKNFKGITEYIEPYMNV